MANVARLGGYGDTSGSGLMFRNRIINGDMRIDQRNSGASVQAANAYTLDRWAALNSSSPSFSIQQNAGSVTTPVGFTNYLGCTVTNAVTPGASQRWSIQQSVEGLNVADLAWGTPNAKLVTVSFWARSSLTGTFGGVIRNSAGNRSYPFTYSMIAANTWEYKTVIINGDTSGTWLTNNGVGLSLVFNLGAGSSLIGTAGAWSGSDLWSATGSVNVISTTSATLYITGVQLEAGDQPTPFEQRPIGTELALCQRYYEDLSNDVYIFCGNVVNTATYYFSYPFKVSKRKTPVSADVTITNANNLSFPAVASTFTAASTEAVRVSRVANATGNAGFFADKILVNCEL